MPNVLGPYSYYQLITLSEQPLYTRGGKLNWTSVWKEKKKKEQPKLGG